MAVGPPILVILGPTASGKSALALEIARRTRGQILSVDSMQVYRGMDIGTAKATPTERAEVRHHLIDLVDPTESFTAARFVEAADAAIAESAKGGIPLIATGGTPLYYKAFFEGLFDGPSANIELRAKLAKLSNEELAVRLARVDPASAARIHVNDTKRLVRALEVFELTGRSISSLQQEWGGRRMRHPATWIGLGWETEALNRRINARVKSMIAAGWVAETAGLLKSFGALSPTAAEATGYEQIIEHLSGKLPLEEAVEQIKIATRQLARRQMKWFRRFPGVHWMEGNRPEADLAQGAQQIWNRT